MAMYSDPYYTRRIFLKRIGQGRTADVFELNEDQIIKLFKKNFHNESINHEYRMSSLAYSLHFRTPRPYDLTIIDDRQAIIFQRIKGSTLLSKLTKKPWLIDSVARTLATLHAEMHDYHVDGIPSGQKDKLIKNITAAPQLTIEEKEKIICYLRDLPDDQKLCHGDFHPDNVLVDNNEDSWVVDWMTGTSGNPAGDVARSVILLDLAAMPENTPKIIERISKLVRRRLTSIYMKEYLKITGLNYTSIEKWILPVAAARLADSVPASEKANVLALVKVHLANL